MAAVEARERLAPWARKAAKRGEKMPGKILDDLLISSTTTSGLFGAGSGRTETIVTWWWQFELDSGSGDNELQLTIEQPSFVGDATTVYFPLDQSRLWQGPYLITANQIEGAPGSDLKMTILTKAGIDEVRFVWTYSGAGSQVFKVNLWTGPL